ncbi:unnamed protein product [Rotaria sordida]|uniref:Phthiocerol/phthiodiolone dimycocerosyl transferase C-terminal domain-containing protein n=2 Tax=Rotaria sordida TaxID=392033 RepID=A0A818WVD3_9BILA|nr:unnamed protein product [Rotaria sordida]
MFTWFQSSSSPVNPRQRMLGSAENALMKASQRYQGYMKIGEVLHLQGPYISLETLTMAISRLQRRHPVLRSRLENDPTNSERYLLVEDDTLCLEILQIPRKRADHLSFWSHEWRERERETTNIGQGLVKFWLLQDPNDDDDENAPRELVIISEHSVSDGLSLSTVAHELLMILGGDSGNIPTESLNWPMTMEDAIRESLSMLSRWYLLNMVNHCHTEVSYGILNKDDTQKLIEQCHREGVTVTSAVSSAIICTASTLVCSNDDQETVIKFNIGADTRRRCVPPVPNHDLSYHVSAILPFLLPTRQTPKTTVDMWQLAKTIGSHIQTSIDAGQVLACGNIVGKLYEKVLGPPNVAQSPTCGVSSWGILPFHEQYGKWKLMAMTPFVNMIQAPLPFITIQTVNGVLTIMCVGPDPVIPRNSIENFRNGIMNNLRQMIEV